jgi:taurine--2-oxoglutarate transaminase
VAMACAYENIKHLLKEDIIGRVKQLAPLFDANMQRLAESHPCIKQYRSIGLFGCLDVHQTCGGNPKLQHHSAHEAFDRYKQVSIPASIALEHFILINDPNGSHHISFFLPFSASLKSFFDNGLMGLHRYPHIHCAPPLTITEDELLDGFDRLHRALNTLDDELGY